jgi:hypothetical protein
MSIRQYMEGMFLCTAPHLLIRVTFSTPTADFNSYACWLGTRYYFDAAVVT